jgi:hypothetical protein
MFKLVSIARSFLPQKEEATITRSNNTRVEHEQKRKIEIGYVNIDNTGNIQNSSSKEEKHSIQPGGTNKLSRGPYTGKQSIKILTQNSLAMVSPHIDHT